MVWFESAQNLLGGASRLFLDKYSALTTTYITITTPPPFFVVIINHLSLSVFLFVLLIYSL